MAHYINVSTDASLTTGVGECVIAILAQWPTNKAEPNKSDPRLKASLGCQRLSAFYWPAFGSQPLAASNVPRKRRLGQPGGNPDGVAKADRARVGSSYLRPEKHGGQGLKAIRLGSIRSRRARLLDKPASIGQGKLPLSPPKQVVVQNRTVQLMSRFQDIVGLALTHWFPDELILENHHPEWLQGMELDFHILNLSLAVEVDGSQHRAWAPGLQHSKAAFLAQVRRDRLKRRLCRENGVMLTRMHKYGEHSLRRFGCFLWSRIGMYCPPLPPEIESQWASHCEVLQKFCQSAGVERRSLFTEATKGKYE